MDTEVQTSPKDEMDTKAGEQLIQCLDRLKESIREDNEEKERLRQQLAAMDDNKDWNRHHLDQLRQQLIERHKCIDIQQKALQEFHRLKETNNGLEEEIKRLKETLKSCGESSEELVQRVTNDMNSRLNEAKESLDLKDKEIQELKLTMSSKDIAINHLTRELSDNKSQSEQNMAEMRELYETKIQSLHKELDRSVQNCLDANDEKIIEVKAQCLRSIDKTKEEYETRVAKLQNDNKELNEKYSHLRLESEARKMTNRFVSTAKTTPKTTSKYKPKANTSDTKTKLSVRVLDSEDESSPPRVELVPHKRKKLIQNNDSYLEFCRENNS